MRGHAHRRTWLRRLCSPGLRLTNSTCPSPAGCGFQEPLFRGSWQHPATAKETRSLEKLAGLLVVIDVWTAPLDNGLSNRDNTFRNWEIPR